MRFLKLPSGSIINLEKIEIIYHERYEGDKINIVSGSRIFDLSDEDKNYILDYIDFMNGK